VADHKGCVTGGRASASKREGQGGGRAKKQPGPGKRLEQPRARQKENKAAGPKKTQRSGADGKVVGREFAQHQNGN